MDKDLIKKVIRFEYDKKELESYKPKKFDEYLLDELAELRVQKQVKNTIDLGGIIKPLPSKKELMEFANNYTKNEMPEFNEQDKIIFRAGVLNCHRWIEENKIG